jgi:hypothetical protein
MALRAIAPQFLGYASEGETVAPSGFAPVSGSVALPASTSKAIREGDVLLLYVSALLFDSLGGGGLELESDGWTFLAGELGHADRMSGAWWRRADGPEAIASFRFRPDGAARAAYGAALLAYRYGTVPAAAAFLGGGTTIPSVNAPAAPAVRVGFWSTIASDPEAPRAWTPPAGFTARANFAKGGPDGTYIVSVLAADEEVGAGATGTATATGTGTGLERNQVSVVMGPGLIEDAGGVKRASWGIAPRGHRRWTRGAHRGIDQGDGQARTPRRGAASVDTGVLPTEVADLGMWLDGLDPETLTLVDSRVSLWADKSTAGRDQAQTVAVLRPFYGEPIVGASGLNLAPNQYVWNASKDALLDGVPGFDIIASIRAPAPSAVGTRALFHFSTDAAPGSNPRVSLRQRATAPGRFELFARRTNVDAGATIANPLELDEGTPAIVAASVNHETQTARLIVNDEATDAADFLTAGVSGTNSYRMLVGCRLTGFGTFGDYYAGGLGELAVFRRALTDDERAAVIAGMKYRAGMT